MSCIDYRFEDHAWGGQEIIDDTAAHSGDFTGLLIVADTVVASMTWKSGYAVNTNKTWANLGTLPAGLYLPGKFASITLTSGKAIAIRKKVTF
jgi:hypothetical protein